MNKVSDFGISKFRRLIPAATFAAVVETLIGFSDSVIAGNLLGSSSLAAVNLILPLMTSVTFLAALLGIGTTVNYSYFQGRCDMERAHRVFSQGIWSALIFGGLILIGIALFQSTYFSYMSAGGEITGQAADYLKYYLPSAILEPVAIILVNSVLVDGNSRLCFISYLVQLTVNAVLSCVFAGVIGISACGLSTTVANVVAILILLMHFCRPENSFRLVRHFDIRDTVRIVRSSLGDASTFICSALCFAIYSKVTISFYGASLLPVTACVVCTLSLLEFFNGVGNALAPVLTVYFGEGNNRSARRLIKYAVNISLLEGMCLSVLLIAVPLLIVRSVGIVDPEIAGYAVKAVRITSVSFIGISLVMLLNSYYVFIDRPWLSVAITFLNGLIVPAALVLAFAGISTGTFWTVIGISPYVALAAFASLLLFRYGRRYFPLLLDSSGDDRIHTFTLMLSPEEITAAAEKVQRLMSEAKANEKSAMMASLMTEEVLMSVRERNVGKRIMAEVTLDFNHNARLTLRDDGEIFDITDANQKISSLRSFIVSSVMEKQSSRRHLVTTGFNRNVFEFMV